MTRKHLFLTLLLCTLFNYLSASYLRNVPQTVIQPNGDTLHCFATGDEFHNWLHDAEGYTIIQHPRTGYYVYANKIDEELVATSYVAGKVNPSTVGLMPKINLSSEQIQAKREAWLANVPAISQERNRATNQGEINNIVIFIRFSDVPEYSASLSMPESRFNSSAERTSSMYNYFKSASYDQLEIFSHLYPTTTGTTIVSYQDANPIGYYRPHHATMNTIGYTNSSESTNRKNALLVAALNAVKDQIPSDLNIDYNNDGNIDNICFIAKATPSGWNELLWPHRSWLYHTNFYIHGKRVYDYNFNLSTDGNLDVSTFCHEMFHTLGAPDLYHYENYTDVSPAGPWDLMEQNRNIPQHSGAYMKMKYGNWIPTDNISEIMTGGTYTLRPLAGGGEKLCYKIATENPHEYYYLEYRHRNSSYFESDIPGNGLLIYRINTNCNSLGACSGNAGFTGVNVLDEVYIFRPGGGMEVNIYGTPIDYYDGDIYTANFNAARNAFNPDTDPFPFLSDGTIGGLDISNIVEFNGDSLQFTYNTTKYINVDNQYFNLPNQVNQNSSFVIESNTKWSIRSSGNWFTLSNATGEGDDTVTISTIGYNTSDDYRYDTLIITGVNASMQMVVLRQEGFSFSITPVTLEMPKEAFSKTITIATVGNWNMMPLFCDWLTVTPTTGSGTTEVTISCQEFTGSGSRSCSLVFLSAGVQKTVEITQTDRSGIEEIGQEGVKIYPNPVDHLLYIENKNSCRTITKCTIYDIYGREIMRQNASGETFHIDMNDYESGLYLIKIEFNDTSIYTSKIIKQ